MDCHDVRSLLAFTRQGRDQIDPAEQAGVQQHLETCVDCAAASQSEQHLDAALGAAMRDVPVPSGGKARLLAKLDASRPRPWLPIAAAAAVLLALGLGATTWLAWPRPHVDRDIAQVKDGDPNKVEEWFRKQGVEMTTWRQLDHSLLWTYDVVEFNGRRVPKLVFFQPSADGRGAIAQVIVLRRDQFDTSDLYDKQDATPNQIIVERDSSPEYVYLIGADNLNLFRIKGGN